MFLWSESEMFRLATTWLPNRAPSPSFVSFENKETSKGFLWLSFEISSDSCSLSLSESVKIPRARNFVLATKRMLEGDGAGGGGGGGCTRSPQKDSVGQKIRRRRRCIILKCELKQKRTPQGQHHVTKSSYETSGTPLSLWSLFIITFVKPSTFVVVLSVHVIVCCLPP